MYKHTWYVCPGHHEYGGCMFCDGGLSSCVTCGGFEGTLTTDCFGAALDAFTLDRIYQTNLDYNNGAWVFTNKRWIQRMTKTELAIFNDWWRNDATSIQKNKMIYL